MISETKPILIIGPPRSGTTLLATMLNAHPDIFIANEAKFFVRILPNYDNHTPAIDVEHAASMIKRYESNELYYLKPLPKANEVLAGREQVDGVTFVRELFCRIAEHEGKRRWGEKTAVAYRRLDLVKAYFPDAILLGLDRDPYEIAASYIKVNPEWGALGALIHWLDFKRAVARKCDSGEVYMVSYKELVNNPESTLRKVCSHIGERYDPGMLEFYKTSRAAFLSNDKTYQGSAKPLYSTNKSLDYLHGGFRGYMMERLIANAPIINQRATWFYILVKAYVYLRAASWKVASRFTEK